MKKIWTTAVVLLIVVVVSVATIQAKQNDSKKAALQQSQAQTKSQTPMSAMQKQFAGYKGETYDKNFLAGMIAHHQGAVAMAQLAVTNAKHQELKDLAANIITAQNTEIGNMEAWQKSWNYPASTGANMQDHSAMTMTNEMNSMTAQLTGKTGDEFDKAFLTNMVIHHQSAIDMSKPATRNAYHQEVQASATKIITAQTKEINKMLMWQSQWGYTASSSSQNNSMPGMSM